MAGGPLIFDEPQPDDSGNVYPAVLVGGANSRKLGGAGVVASLGADAILHCHADLPKTVLPPGTAKLRLRAAANAVAGNAKVNPKWALGASPFDFDGATLAAEGASTLTWGAGNAYEIMELLITLDAATWVGAAGKWLYIALTFETSGWTLAAESVWAPPTLIWE